MYRLDAVAVFQGACNLLKAGLMGTQEVGFRSSGQASQQSLEIGKRCVDEGDLRDRLMAGCCSVHEKPLGIDRQNGGNLFALWWPDYVCPMGCMTLQEVARSLHFGAVIQSWPGCAESAGMGRRMVNIVPPAGGHSTDMLPWCNWTILATRDNPRPAPGLSFTFLPR